MTIRKAVAVGVLAGSLALGGVWAFQAANPVSTIPFDELTRLKVQNIQLQIAPLQQQAQETVEKFMQAQGVKADEWLVDIQRYALVRKETKEAK